MTYTNRQNRFPRKGIFDINKIKKHKKLQKPLYKNLKKKMKNKKTNTKKIFKNVKKLWDIQRPSSTYTTE